MRSFKFALLVSALFGISIISLPAQAVWTEPKNLIPSYGVNIVDSFFNTGEHVSRLEGGPEAKPGEFPPRALCKKYGVAPCDNPDWSYSGYFLLPTCAADIRDWCVEGLALSQSGQRVEAQYIRAVESELLPADPSVDMPPGASKSLWNVPGFKNSSGETTYATYVMISGHKAKNSKFAINNFRAMVIPYELRTGNEYERAFTEMITTPSGQSIVSIRGSNPECVWTENAKCGAIVDFAPGVRAELSLRLGNNVTGWLMGRLEQPEISVTPISTSQNRLVIKAAPATIPKFYASVPKSSANETVTAWVKKTAMPGSDPNVMNMLANTYPIDALTAFAPVVNDMAVATISTWSVNSIDGGMGSRCLNDSTRLLGMVTTNALIYQGNAPGFADGALDYKVAGVHFNPDKSEFSGQYNLTMRSDVARCLYGFSNAPLQATVTVTYGGGEAKIATQNMTETDGWLKLNAAGFTFSAPTIRVKLSQPKVEQAVAPAPTAQPVASAPVVSNPAPAASPKATTITCVKGKTIKKVSGVSPKCPTGFKKK